MWLKGICPAISAVIWIFTGVWFEVEKEGGGGGGHGGLGGMMGKTHFTLK